MSYIYVAEEVPPVSEPDVIARYEEEGIYNSEPYYVKDEGFPNWYVFYSTLNTRWQIYSSLDPVESKWYCPTLEGIYLPNFFETGQLNVSLINPEIYRKTVSNQLNLTSTLSGGLAPEFCNHDWVRWCYASINKHFDDRKGPYSLYIEGDERDELDESEFAELRIDGPFITIPQKHLYILDIEINVLCQTHQDPKRFYKAQRMVGVFMKAFENLIEIYKYGDGPFDTGGLLECFHLQRDLRESIEINYYGIVRSDTKLFQTTIEGHYRLELWTIGD